MIKANDFRVGNYIMYNESTTWLKVEYIAKTAIGAIDINNISFYHFKENEIIPIPLTPEILEKVGFKLSMGSLTYYLNVFYKEKLYCCLQYLTITSQFELCKDGFSLLSMPILFLHQLQNLIHSLKGEELQINLKELVTVK